MDDQNTVNTNASTDGVNDSAATNPEISSSKAPSNTESLLKLEDYIQTTKINPGLIASFKAESANDISTPRSVEQWQKDFKAQSERVYK